MSDYSELKRLASAAKNWGGEIGEHRWYEAGCFKQPGFSVPDAEFLAGCEPGAVLALIAEIDGLREEVELDNKIIAERDRLLNAIPECAAHGQCVPHAIQWVKDVQVENSQLLEERDQLKAEVEALRSFILGFAEYDAEMAHAYAAMSKEAGQ